ncbi:MAG: glutathione S-transferase [Myxococcales bacterium]|nr:glutathione S-transferase [Myxococcales bacterium]
MTPILLTGRSASHFTRVARIFAHELAVPFELDIVQDLTSLDAAAYGGHPALKLPTLHVGDTQIFGTDNICRKLAEIAGREDDQRVVLSHQVSSDLVRAAQELVWHAMAVQVQLVIGVQVAKLSAESMFFTKAAAGMHGALGWLDERLDHVLAALPSPRDVSVFEVTLFCLVEHVMFRPTISLDAFPQLREYATRFAARESAQRTVFRFDPAPARSLGR